MTVCQLEFEPIQFLAQKKICIVLITPHVNQPENVVGLVLDVVIRLFRREVCAEPVCGVNEINGLYAAALAVLVEVQRLHKRPG